MKRLIWALRDSQALVRQAAAEVAFVLKSKELKDILFFRIEKESDFKVRIACLKALTQYDQALWREPLQLILQNPATDPQLWKEIFRIFLKEKVQGLDKIALNLVEREKRQEIFLAHPVGGCPSCSERIRFTRNLWLYSSKSKRHRQKFYLTRYLHSAKKEFISDIKRLAEQDEDAEVRSLAGSILKEWEQATPKSSAQS